MNVSVLSVRYPQLRYPQLPQFMPLQVFLGASMSSDSDSDGDTDSGSDSTLEDLDSPDQMTFGHPLERMIRLESFDNPDDSAIADALYHSNFSSCSSDSLSSTSSITHDIDFEALVDDLLSKHPFPLSESRNLIMVDHSTPTSKNIIMVKYFQPTSHELFLLLQLNHCELREDPWNPAPHILCAIERNGGVFLCMEPLIEFNQPPFKVVANYIDFFKQTLEGLTFLHEHKIAQLSCLDPTSFMVDIGVDTSAEHFDRTIYPVRYYYTNFSRAAQFDSSPCDSVPFRKDVQECGMMMDRLLVDVPRVGPKLKSLVNAMTSGAFGADDARKLFEALCKSLEASVFDIPVPDKTSLDPSLSTPVPPSRHISFASPSNASSSV